MQSILFRIPNEVGGLPLFGVGILLAAWLALCAARIAWSVWRHGWSAHLWNELPVMLVGAAIFGFVLPAVADEQGLAIRGYGVMLFLGVVSGGALAVYRATRDGYDAELIYSLALWMCVCGIIGARLFYVIEYWDEFNKGSLGATLAAIAQYTRGGLVVYGSLVGAGLAAIVFFVRHRLPVLAMADLVAPSLTLGLAFGRLGCFLNGCCFGGHCELPWAVRFPADSPPYLNQVASGEIALHGIHFDAAQEAPVIAAIDQDASAASSGLTAGDRITKITIGTPGTQSPLVYPADAGKIDKPSGLNRVEAAAALVGIQPGTQVQFQVLNAGGQPATRTWTAAGSLSVPARSNPVHPAQLYSAIDAALLTLVLLAWYPLRRHDGEVTALMLTIYPVSRFLQEIIRTDERAVFGTGMSISQNISLLVLAAAVVLWIYVLRSPRLRYAASL